MLLWSVQSLKTEDIKWVSWIYRGVGPLFERHEPAERIPGIIETAGGLDKLVNAKPKKRASKSRGASNQAAGEKPRPAPREGGKSGANPDDSLSQRHRGDDPVLIEIDATLVGKGLEFMSLPRGCIADTRMRIDRVGSKFAVTILNAVEVSGNDE